MNLFQVLSSKKLVRKINDGVKSSLNFKQAVCDAAPQMDVLAFFFRVAGPILAPLNLLSSYVMEGGIEGIMDFVLSIIEVFELIMNLFDNLDTSGLDNIRGVQGGIGYGGYNGHGGNIHGLGMGG